MIQLDPHTGKSTSTRIAFLEPESMRLWTGGLHTSAIFIMGWIYTQKRMYEQALAGYQQLDPSLIVWQEKGFGATYAAAGDKKKALKVETDLKRGAAPATTLRPSKLLWAIKRKLSLGWKMAIGCATPEWSTLGSIAATTACVTTRVTGIW
jgi:hypothetical protein